MIKNAVIVSTSVFAAAVWADVPQVSDVLSIQDSSTREVLVSYTLSSPAIVTLSVEQAYPPFFFCASLRRTW